MATLMRCESVTSFAHSIMVTRLKHIAAVVLLCMSSAGARSQTYQEVNYFSSCYWDDNTGWHCPDGAGPKGTLIQGRDGFFYGTTTSDGKFGRGTVFRMTPEGRLTTLAAFGSGDGDHAYGALLQARDGTLYGTTLYGGIGGGTMFKVTLDGTLTTIGVFTSGAGPVGELAEGADGLLYGVTREGGDNNSHGTIFRVSTNGWSWNEMSIYMHLFYAGSPEGYYPSGGLLLASDGNFYGVTAGLYGTVYKLTLDGTVSLVAAFPDGADGAAWPSGKLVEAEDGSFYGASDSTTHGGAIFKFTRDGTLTTVAHFNFANGQSPLGLILARDGNFYGLSYDGGTGYIPPQPCGTAFRMTPDGTLSGLFSFTGYGGEYPGAHPWAGLVEGSDGNLYGTTKDGGVIGAGNIFRLIMPGPRLASTQAGQQLVLSWRTNYAGFTLQNSQELTSGNWTDCTNSPVVAGGQFFVTNSISTGARFFRLRK